MTVTPALHVYSFGWGHQDPSVPHADIVCDVRDWFRNPDIDPKLVIHTGRDADVIAEVLGTRGVAAYLNGLFVLTMPLIRAQLRTVTVNIGCAGGRHRAPVLADRLAEDVAKLLDVTTAVTHLHIDKPILLRSGSATTSAPNTATMGRAASRLRGTAIENAQAIERAVLRSNSCATCWPRPCGPGPLRSECRRRSS